MDEALRILMIVFETVALVRSATFPA